MKEERFVFSTQKKAQAFAETFEKKHRLKYPLVTVSKDKAHPVWYVFTSIITK